jgi:hypothetical protein
MMKLRKRPAALLVLSLLVWAVAAQDGPEAASASADEVCFLTTLQSVCCACERMHGWERAWVTQSPQNTVTLYKSSAAADNQS